MLETLLESYAGTRYGKEHGAGSVATIADYRRAFPVTTYEEYKPLIHRVMAGDNDLLLTEEVIGWAITRGTTKGESKFIPMTPTDLMMRISAGRAMMNYVLTSGRFELFQGVNLNLNFPSVVGTVRWATGRSSTAIAPASTSSMSRRRRPCGRCRRRRRSTPWAVARPSATGTRASNWPTRSARTRT